MVSEHAALSSATCSKSLHLRIEIGKHIEPAVEVSKLGGVRRDSRAADLLDFFRGQLTGANASQDSYILICHIDSALSGSWQDEYWPKRPAVGYRESPVCQANRITGTGLKWFPHWREMAGCRGPGNLHYSWLSNFERQSPPFLIGSLAIFDCSNRLRR